MGNSFSKTPDIPDITNIEKHIYESKKEAELEKAIDKIASHYILSMNYKNLRNLYDKDYCNKMVILTSKVIDKYFTSFETEKLSRRMNDGKVELISTENLQQLDIDDPEKKQEKCNQISKFYIKIAHIFSAIVMSVNPEYIYKDMFGNNNIKNIFEKKEGDGGKLVKMNLCSTRIHALENQLNRGVEGVEGVGGERKPLRPLEKYTLDQEVGIPELMDLYYDEYNHKTDHFDKMSEATRKKFHSDLKKFYTQFTGHKHMPEHIKKFSDIHLSHVERKESLDRNKKSSKTDMKKNDLFILYAENLKQMVKSVESKQEKMLNMLNALFLVETENGEENIRIHPSLTQDSLQDIVVLTRNLIMELYLTCEDDYLEGMQIYEAIVERQILDTSKSQLESLDKLYYKLKSS